MILHARNISLDRISLYFDTGAPSHLCWLPFVGKLYESKFKRQFSQVFSKEDVDKVSNSEIALAVIYNKGFNILPAIHQVIYLSAGLELTKKVKERLSRAFDLFEEYMEFKYTKLSDLDKLKSKAQYFQRKYQSLAPKKNDEVTEQKKFDFETIIINVEILLGRTIPRSLQLFQFIPYFNMAVKRSQKLDKKNG